VIERALAILTQEQALVEGNTKSGNRYWVIRKDKLHITPEVTSLVCSGCGHSVSGGKPEGLAKIALPCLNPTCDGHYTAESEKVDYFGDLYRTGDVARIHAEEHTGLISREEREWIERRFIGADDVRKTDPNLLSCTPTLEMGIDIGDLSSVLLCSVPPQTANYVQRVGRAGRRDGNAFSLTVANAQPHDLYYYREPVEMMGGAVSPPGVFFSAPAVLQRQFLAFCFDQWIAKTDPKPFVPKKISPALNNVLSPADPPSGFPYDLLAFIKKHRATALDEFLSLFGSLLNDEARAALSNFIHGEGTSNDSIDGRVVNRLRTYANELEDLKKRRDEVRVKLRKIEAISPRDEALEDELEELSQTAKGLTGIIATIRNTKTLQFFTDEGLLPNYAFPEEGVTLRSIILRKKEKKSDDREGNYRSETLEYQRPAASAIRELAPGSSFYAQHRRLTVDQVNLRLSEPERWNFCDQCAHIVKIVDSKKLSSCCPVCGSSGWADASMRRWMIPMRQVITTEFDRYSRTHDESDERSPEFFDSQISVSIEPDEIEKAYQVKNSVIPFGFEFVRQATMRTVNLGQQSFAGESEMLAGQERTAKGFRICPQCGKVKGIRKGGDSKFRHDITCPRRGKPEEEDADLPAYFLYRELTSEALRLLVPSVGGSQNDELDSFIAALQLGLEAHFKGNIDHLGSCTEIRPIPESSFSRVYLVVYDKVPGGTGYLKELSLDSSRIIKVLNSALDIIKDCQCKSEDDKDGCHRCVLKKRRSSGSSSEPRRSVAIQILEQILSHGDEIEEIPSVAKIDINPLIESQLEKRFIDALGATSEATLKTELISGKNGYVLNINQQQWEIVPQVEIDLRASGTKTRADFTIRPLRKKDSLPIVVYLDGFAYHADEAAGKNRVAKDIVQREALRESGNWIVWSLTWEDLSPKLAAGKWTHPGQDDKQITQKLHLLKTISKDIFSFYSDKEHLSSWRHLVAYLQDPNIARLTQYAYCQILALSQIQPIKAGVMEKKLEQLLEINLDEITDTEVDGNSNELGFIDTFDHGRWRIAAASNVEALKSRTYDALRAVIRFDDHTRLEPGEFHGDWQGLLRLHNLLQFLPGIHFTTERAIRDGLENFSYHKANTSHPPSGESWAEASKWDLDQDLVHESLTDLIVELQKFEIPTPTCGYELIGLDGSIVAEAELAWESLKAVVLTEDQVVFKDSFTEQGWRTFVSSESEPLKPETLNQIFS
jgi:DEAD/DEAH box helicase domain-containing protein